MNAEPFRGDADGPEQIIDTAEDGTRLKDCRGWVCDACGTLHADKAAAELCCMEPDAVATAATGQSA